jgi:DNA-binding transcriptional regulator YhcF (GntR family)
VAWSVDPRSDVPPSRQLVLAVLDALASDELASGAQLPSVRALAAQALVNHNTVARAYLELEHLGAVEGRNGRGVFVTSAGPRIARKARRDSTLAAFARATREALRAGHERAELAALLERESDTRRSA